MRLTIARPLDRPQPLGDLLVFRERKRNAVPFGLEVRRIEVEQRVRPIATINGRRPIEPLNVRIREANVRNVSRR